MDNNQNREQVLANDKDIIRQVPLIMLDKTGTQKPQCVRNEEIFYRAVNK